MRFRYGNDRHKSTEFISLDTSLCQACWKCIEACPESVLAKINVPFHKHSRIDRPDRCKGCRKCMEVCEAKAIIYNREAA
jgi:Pyruvate/2-oxoacid:ferredoxin oxidoreductase delta subunit